MNRGIESSNRPESLVFQGLGVSPSPVNLKTIISDRRMQCMALLGLVCGLTLLFWLMYMGYGLEDLKGSWDWFEGFMEKRPWLLFVAIAILPALPIPVSPVVILAGAIFHEHPLLVCLGCLLALMANQAWTYWLAAKPGRRFVHWMLERSKVEIPDVSLAGQMHWMLILRLTPGFPFCVQNYMLGLIRVPFLRYTWVSILCSGPIAIGMVLTGAGVGDGRIGPIIGGVGFLIVVIVVLRLIGKRLMRSAQSDT